MTQDVTLRLRLGTTSKAETAPGEPGGVTVGHGDPGSADRLDSAGGPAGTITVTVTVPRACQWLGAYRSTALWHGPTASEPY